MQRGGAGKIISSICDYFEKNIEFIRLIINNNVNPAFAQNLLAMDSLREMVRKSFDASKSEAELEYFYNFLTYGAFRMVCIWLNKEEREAPEKIAKIIIQMMLNR